MTMDNVSNAKETKVKVDYLKELLMDRTVLSNYPNVFLHVAKILEKESDLPEPSGPKVNLQCKVYMPTEANSSFNFVGRILGPEGSTAKCLQQCLGVKIMVRGRGSMRDRKKEESNIGRPNWEHLSDKLHVVLTVDDFESRAKARLAKASDYITLFLKESTKGSDREDKVKQMQLMELSFQRDLRSTWALDCHNLMDLGKTGSLYPGGASLLNFAYPAAYQPLFSAIHEVAQQQHNSAPGFHARHYYASPAGTQQASQQPQPSGQHQQQYQQQQHQHSQGHFSSVPVSHGGHMANANGAGALHNNQQMAAAAAAAMSVGGLAFPSSSMSTNLGNATLLLGPANAQGHHHHPGTYSPPVGAGVQVTGNSASALPPGTVAVAPMSYWQAGPSAGPHALSHMTAAAAAAATLDYHHAHLHHAQHHHPHHLQHTGHEHLGHVQQAAGYPLPTAPYATAAHLHPLGFSGELVQPALGQEYSLCARDGQPAVEGTVSAIGTPASVGGAVSSAVPLVSALGDVRCTEAVAVSTHSTGKAGANVGSGGMSGSLEATGGDASGAKETATAPGKAGKHAQANVGSATSSFSTTSNLGAGKNSSTGTNQAPAKYNITVGGSGAKQRYSQKHHSQFNLGRNSQQQQQQQSQQAPLPIHGAQQQQQHGTRAGRSEIVTVHVGSSEQSSTAKPAHGTPGGDPSNKSGFVTVAKAKGPSPGNTEPVGGRPETCSTGGGPPATTGKETRAGAVAKSQASSPTAKKAVVSASDTDWPKLGTDVKLSKPTNAGPPESQLGQGLLNLSIGNTSSKAI